MKHKLESLLMPNPSENFLKAYPEEILWLMN